MAARGGSAVLALLVLSILINYLDRGALSVAAPVLARELELDPKQMGLLFSAFFWTYATFQLVTGTLVDRYPVKWVYAGGYLIWSLATAAVGLSYSIPMLLAARFALGMGESVAFPACSRILAVSVPESRRGWANAVIDAGAKAGPGLSTMLGGLAVATYGWRAMFLVVGLGSLLWLIPWVTMAPAGLGATSNETQAPGWSALLGKRSVWITSICMFTYGYVNYFLMTWLPLYLTTQRGYTLAEMALFGSIPFWAMAVGSLAAGWTSDALIRSGRKEGDVRKAYAAWGLFGTGAALAPVPMVESAAVALFLLTVASVFLGAFSANVWAMTQTLAGPLAAGRWTGFQNFIGNLGGVVAPLLTGWIVAGTGSFLYAFWLTAGVLAVGVILYRVALGKVEPVAW